MTHSDFSRYARHLLLPEVGLVGQKTLRLSHVAVVGLGGLGCPAALYLAAAGVGCLSLIDDDVVSLSNLQRQILYDTGEIGELKVLAAKQRLQSLNPDIEVRGLSERLTASNATRLLAGANVVLDGSDNFPTRYLTSDYSVLHRVPVVFGALERFVGQVMVIHPEAGGPCYRCLHPVPPSPGAVPTCDEAGVLGVLPGLVGTLQAAETLKILLSKGRPLIGRIQIHDVLAGSCRTVELRPDPACSACGSSPKIHTLQDRIWSCGFQNEGRIEELPVSRLLELMSGQARDGIVLVDVRRPDEIQNGMIPGALEIPLDHLPNQLDELTAAASGKALIFYCQRGSRSLKAAGLIAPQIGTTLYSLRGGYESYLAVGGRTGLPRS
jgi:molybdopterin/thiamine biosynthesis adenylyltransferase/rhodanese-related sulfurtransferase